MVTLHVARTRSRNGGSITNLYYHYLPPPFPQGDPPSTTGFQMDETCVDSLGPTTDHPLTLTRDEISGGFFDWYGTYHGTGHIGSGLAVPGGGDSIISNWLSQFTAQRIAAATAPTKPAVHNLTNFLEFKDIPRMLKNAGDLLLGIRDPRRLFSSHLVASTTLAYQFGWVPILGDLLKMANFGQLVAQRQQQIGELNSGKTVRRKVNFGSLHGGGGSLETVHSINGIVISSPATTTWNVKAWATIRWQLANMNLLGRKPTWWESFNELYGITPLGITVQIWKALPWTWVIDWFAHVSDALEVSRNLIDYKPSRINLMWTESKQVIYRPLLSGVGTSLRRFDGAHRNVTIKNRNEPSVSSVTGLHLSVPFLDAFKLSVLSSLTILAILHGRARSYS